MTLAAAVDAIERQFGKGSLVRLGDDPLERPPVVPTGALTLDLALGVGGLPKGRIVEIFGPEGSGKTTLLYHLIAQAQAMGDTCAFIDTEHRMDPDYAGLIGADVDALYISQPEYGEKGLEIADQLIRSGDVGLVVIDSVANLVPKAEIEGEMGDVHVGLHARMMAQAVRKLAGNVSKAGALVVFTNQLRSMVGVMYGPSETTTGGRALRFYASVRIDLRKIETRLDGNKEAIGTRVRAKVVKNSLAAPFRKAEFDIDFGRGISNEGCLIDRGLKHGLLTKHGTYLRSGDVSLGQGREKAKECLSDTPELAARLQAEIQRIEAGAETASPEKNPSPNGQAYA